MVREISMTKSKSPIPIKNLFFMLCYAWNILSIKDNVKVAEEEIKDAYNLLTRLLIFGVQKLIRGGFYKTYIDVEDDLSCLKGKINVNDTIKLNVKSIKKCSCEYDEFSRNNVFNGIIKYALRLMIKNETVTQDIKKNIRSALLYFNDINEVKPTKKILAKLKFNNNNKNYKMILNICLMISESTLVNEEDGNIAFKDFYRDNQMQKVYEKFILNFYALNLDRNTYKVHAPKINWHIDEDATMFWADDFDVDTNIGDRRTDIVIENLNKKNQFIIDAKYYCEAMLPSYQSSSSSSYRTAHINQIRGYILDSDFVGNKTGALMYPTVKIDMDKGRFIPIQGSHIIMKTLNLNKEWQDIEKDLLSFAHKVLDK